MHLTYSKGHSNKGLCSIAISMLGQALKVQSLWIIFFDISCTAVNEHYWCSRLQTKQDRLLLCVYRNRVPIFSELKVNSVV